MAENNGSNRGGKRPGSGRKRREPWDELWWIGFRTGNPAMMRRADEMRDAKAASNKCDINEPRGASDFSSDRERLPGLVAGSGPPESATPPANDEGIQTSDKSSKLAGKRPGPVAAQEPPESETPPALSAEDRARRAKKQRAWRQRQRVGIAVLHVPVPFADFVTALIESGRLSPAEALDRRRVEVVGGEVFAEWSRRWLQENL